MVITIRHLAHIATHIAAHIENHRQCVPPWRLAADEITPRPRRHYGSSPTTLRLVFLDIFAFSLRHPKIFRTFAADNGYAGVPPAAAASETLAYPCKAVKYPLVIQPHRGSPPVSVVTTARVTLHFVSMCSGDDSKGQLAKVRLPHQPPCRDPQSLCLR